MQADDITHKIIGCAMKVHNIRGNGFPEIRRVDCFVENCIMLEIKAFNKIDDVYKNQAINYLEVYNIADGLLINFGGLSLDFKKCTIKNL